MTLTGHHFYLITKVCWNLGTSQSNRFHGISNIFPHVAGEVIYHLQVETCCSDCGASQTHLQTDTLSLSQAVSSQNPAHQLWMSSTVLALISASAWLSHPVGSVSAMIKGSAQCRCHFHKSGHAGAAVVGISCEAPASLGAGTVVLSWGWARISHPHTAHWGWKHLGPLMLLGVSQDLGMTTGQQFWIYLHKIPISKAATWSPVVACMTVRDLKVIFQEVEKAIHCDFYGGDLFQFIDRNCSHNSKEIAKREKMRYVFFMLTKWKEIKTTVFWDVIQKSELIIFKFFMGFRFWILFTRSIQMLLSMTLFSPSKKKN